MRDSERNQGLVDWLLACPVKGQLDRVPSEHAYTDYLGLYRTADGWKIVNKHFQSHR